ncbi:MAG TPA: hypothetical protein VEX41_09280 [Candidatus Eisenbacteria bacterium]|nr:hypothetical protein [Candidatus Eisenbacteria bacterium]
MTISSHRPDRSARGPADAGRRPAATGRAGAGRASRRRAPLRQASFLERNRGPLLVALGVAVLGLLGFFAFQGLTSPAYACSTIWTPAPTAEPAPGATARLGYVQDDMGREHVTPGTVVRYTFCPPASSKHYNASGLGPIKPALYGPDDRQAPGGWIHNMEHGGLVLLYRCGEPAAGAPSGALPAGEGCTDAGQRALKQLYDDWPASPVCGVPPHLIGPVIARFDDMAWPYAAILWDLVLPLDHFDRDAILAFYAQQGERTNPEAQCAAPTPGATTAPTETASPAPSVASSPAAVTSSPAPAVTASPEASPSGPAVSPSP